MVIKRRIRAILGALVATGGIGGAYLYKQRSVQPRCDQSKTENCSTNCDDKDWNEENPDQNPAIYFPSLTANGQSSQQTKEEEEKRKGTICSSVTTCNEQLAEPSKTKEEVSSVARSTTTSWFPSIFAIREKLPENTNVQSCAASTSQSDDSNLTKNPAKSLINSKPIQWNVTSNSDANKAPKETPNNLDCTKVNEAELLDDISPNEKAPSVFGRLLSGLAYSRQKDEETHTDPIKAFLYSRID